ncbi:F-box/kelch-repeat protein At3g06240-like [Papaver somniferum]|uniref:F-box/kelch-repeat protein At3g06240-like n=1 Tax=Papaver somniferum TaxID=3469 RepID=UPI000E6F55F8|nr:F-box/kelch-repeat protein At3g06240-like [Papaver somniferum]
MEQGFYSLRLGEQYDHFNNMHHAEDRFSNMQHAVNLAALNSPPFAGIVEYDTDLENSDLEDNNLEDRYLDNLGPNEYSGRKKLGDKGLRLERNRKTRLKRPSLIQNKKLGDQYKLEVSTGKKNIQGEEMSYTPRKKKLPRSIQFLPDEIITNILSRLTAKDIARLRYVCKLWYTLCSNPSFVQLHLNHATENNNFSLMIEGSKGLYSVDNYCDSLSSTPCYEASRVDYPFKSSKYAVSILGSANGLLCINPAENVICIWNPSTQESKILPSEVSGNLNTDALCSFSAPTYGFGYDRGTVDYKLVKVVRFLTCKHGDGYNVSVYSLKSNSWKSIVNTLSYRRFSTLPGVFVNGALHWIATTRRSTASIVSFDIRDEIFAEVPLPPRLDHDGNAVSVGVLGGCLSMLSDNCFLDRIGVWVMKDYQVKESWTKLYSISVQKTVLFRSFHDLKLISYVKTGEFLFEKDCSVFVLYNPTAESARILKIYGARKEFVTETYIGSLISPNLIDS